MAGLAFDFVLLAMVQGKYMLAKVRRFPSGRCVAAPAVLAKDAEMNFRLDMAADAFIRCSRQYGRLVTTNAINLGMCPLKPKRLLVIEMNHTIEAIMTSLAIIAIKGCMDIGENKICLMMAAEAVDHIDRKFVIRVTISTFERFPIKSDLVFN